MQWVLLPPTNVKKWIYDDRDTLEVPFARRVVYKPLTIDPDLCADCCVVNCLSHDTKQTVSSDTNTEREFTIVTTVDYFLITAHVNSL